MRERERAEEIERFVLEAIEKLTAIRNDQHVGLHFRKGITTAGTLGPLYPHVYHRDKTAILLLRFKNKRANKREKQGLKRKITVNKQCSSIEF